MEFLYSDPSSPGHSKKTELLKAMETRDFKSLIKSIADNPDLVHTIDENGQTPLHIALSSSSTYDQHKETVSFLLQHGASHVVKDKHGRTPVDVFKANQCSEYEESTKEENKGKMLKILEESFVLEREEAIKVYKDTPEYGKVTINPKIFVLGSREVGKSLIDAMLDKHHEPSWVKTYTTVFQIDEDSNKWRELERDERKKMVIFDAKYGQILNFWARRQIFQPLLTCGCYIVVFSLIDRLDDQTFEVLMFFIRTIYEHGILRHGGVERVLGGKIASPPICLVGTHKDKLTGTKEEKNIKIEVFRNRLFSELRDTPYERHVDPTIYAVDTTDLLDEGTEKLKKVIGGYMKEMAVTVPDSWADFQAKLQEAGKTRFYMSLDEVAKIANGCGISESNVDDALDFLQYSGNIFYSKMNIKLKNIVITDLNMFLMVNRHELHFGSQYLIATEDVLLHFLYCGEKDDKKCI